MKKSRKRQLDSNTEQVHESDTYCPSVERALFKQCKLQQLLDQSSLKKEGIMAAQALIKVQYQEIQSLIGQKQLLQTQIQIMLRQFSQKEEHLKRQIAYLQQDLKQVLEMRELRAAQMRDINSRSSLSKCFLPSSSRKLSVPKSYKSIEKKTEQKSHYHESPIRKMSLVETVSKEYVEQDYQLGAKVCQEAVTNLLSEDIERLVVDFEQISDLIKDQKDELMQYLRKQQQNEHKVKQLSRQLKSPVNNQLNSYQNTQLKIKYQQSKPKSNKKQQTRGQKLFSTQNSNQASPDRMKFFSSWQDKIKQQSKQDIPLKSVIKQYEDIIQQYKEYSAYLRAYLCSCISFISKSTEEMAENNPLYCLESERLKNSQESECLSTDRSNNLVNFPSNRVFEVILKDIMTTVEDKIHMEKDIRRQLQEQNKQLRQILDDLVDNLKRSGIKTNTNAKKSTDWKQTSYEMLSPQLDTSKNKVKRGQLLESSRSKQQYSYKQSCYGSVKSRDQTKDMFDKPYKKSIHPPQLHRITLTQYKRYNNEEE